MKEMRKHNTHETRLVILPDGHAYSMKPGTVEKFIKRDMEICTWRKREDYQVKEVSGIVYREMHHKGKGK